MELGSEVLKEQSHKRTVAILKERNLNHDFHTKK